MKDPLRTIAKSRAIEALLERVQRGELTPDAAEAEALRLGLGKLSTTTNPSRFDPMTETWWTMPMAVAWIAWRSPDEVRGFWDTYRRKCWNWNFRKWRDGPGGPVHAGHFLERSRPATFTLVLLRERYCQKNSLIPDGAISIREAKRQLWNALEEDAMQATGIDIETKQRVKIAIHSWRDLEDIEESGKVILRPRNRRRDKMVGYEDVVVRRQALMSRWPPHRGLSLNSLSSSFTTGAPGRPTSMHLVEVEYRVRCERGEAKTSIGAVAKELAEWLHDKHPNVPQLKPKTIANNLRGEHRKRINAQN
jgi:hypothetical protein